MRSSAQKPKQEKTDRMIFEPSTFLPHHGGSDADPQFDGSLLVGSCESRRPAPGVASMSIQVRAPLDPVTRTYVVDVPPGTLGRWACDLNVVFTRYPPFILKDPLRAGHDDMVLDPLPEGSLIPLADGEIY